MARLFEAHSNHLRARMHPLTDAVGVSRTPTERWRQLPGYWAVGTVLESHRDAY